MVYGKGRLLAGFLCAAFLGVVLHFLYGWWPNGVTAMISPLGESIWEHVKILYWPLVGVVVLGILIVAFTLWPGEGLIFADLSAAPSWAELPC